MVNTLLLLLLLLAEFLFRVSGVWLFWVPNLNEVTFQSRLGFPTTQQHLQSQENQGLASRLGQTCSF